MKIKSEWKKLKVNKKAMRKQREKSRGRKWQALA
jgi:hypothetical protein